MRLIYRQFLEWRTRASPALIRTCWPELAAHYPAFGLAQSRLPRLLRSLCSCLFLFGYHCTCNWYTNLTYLCVSGLVRSFTSLLRVLIFSNKEMVKYTLEKRIFLFDSYVKKNSYKSCERRFRRRYPGVRIPTSSTILRLVKKVRSTGSFLDKKYTRQNAVLKLGSIWVGISMPKTKGIGAVKSEADVWSAPSWSEDWCVVCHYCFTNSRTHIFFKTLLIQSGMSVTFYGPFSGALRKKKRHMVILCKMVLQHTLPFIP
jgi:hypothetical protein